MKITYREYYHGSLRRNLTLTPQIMEKLTFELKAWTSAPELVPEINDDFMYKVYNYNDGSPENIDLPSINNPTWTCDIFSLIRDVIDEFVWEYGVVDEDSRDEQTDDIDIDWSEV